jgi:hypothetical protein
MGGETTFTQARPYSEKDDVNWLDIRKLVARLSWGKRNNFLAINHARVITRFDLLSYLLPLSIILSLLRY